MIARVPKEKKPDLLLETARVLNAAGPNFETAAAAMAAEALKVRDAAKPPIRDAITADGAALYLSGRLPGGYVEALKLLEPIDEPADSDGRLHLLHALALGQKYNAVQKPFVASKLDKDPELKNDPKGLNKLIQGNTELANLTKQIKKDLAAALARNPSLKEENKCFWNPEDSKDCVDEEDDLRLVFQDDDDGTFKALVKTDAEKKKDAAAKAVSEEKQDAAVKPDSKPEAGPAKDSNPPTTDTH
jgi:hypothetical protein